jgi:hypothetical protein
MGNATIVLNTSVANNFVVMRLLYTKIFILSRGRLDIVDKVWYNFCSNPHEGENMSKKKGDEEVTAGDDKVTTPELFIAQPLFADGVAMFDKPGGKRIGTVMRGDEVQVLKELEEGFFQIISADGVEGAVPNITFEVKE